MRYPLRAVLALGFLFAAVAPAAAQQNGGMKHDAMKHDAMMKSDSMKSTDSMMGHGSMMAMMPHGTFAGQHDHTVTGGYAITSKEGRQAVVLGGDFALDGAPDPYVVLSGDEMGSGSQTLNLGKLKNKKGTSAYEIPAGTDLSHYSHVLIWCRKYNVTLGSAELAAADGMMHH